jgi:hypothetical protein
MHQLEIRSFSWQEFRDIQDKLKKPMISNLDLVDVVQLELHDL